MNNKLTKLIFEVFEDLARGEEQSEVFVRTSYEREAKKSKGKGDKHMILDNI